MNWLDKLKLKIQEQRLKVLLKTSDSYKDFMQQRDSAESSFVLVQGKRPRG